MTKRKKPASEPVLTGTDLLMSLADDYASRAYDEASENGPDRDYRRWAQEAKNAARKTLLNALTGLKVYVVAANDYPDCVLATEAEAEAYVRERMDDPKNRHMGSTAVRIYYRVYDYQVGVRGRRMWQ